MTYDFMRMSNDYCQADAKTYRSEIRSAVEAGSSKLTDSIQVADVPNA